MEQGNQRPMGRPNSSAYVKYAAIAVVWIALVVALSYWAISRHRAHNSYFNAGQATDEPLVSLRAAGPMFNAHVRIVGAGEFAGGYTPGMKLGVGEIYLFPPSGSIRSVFTTWGIHPKWMNPKLELELAFLDPSGVVASVVTGLTSCGTAPCTTIEVPNSCCALLMLNQDFLLHGIRPGVRIEGIDSAIDASLRHTIDLETLRPTRVRDSP